MGNDFCNVVATFVVVVVVVVVCGDGVGVDGDCVKSITSYVI